MSSKTPLRRAPRFVAALVEAGRGAVDAVRVSERKSSLWLDAWRDLRGRWMFWLAGAVILLLIVVAAFPGLFTQVDPRACALKFSNDPPTDGHPLGFTFQGCDIYSRIIHGTSTSLMVGLLVTTIVAIIGILVGACAGFFGGWLDSLLMRVGDVCFAIRYILAAVVIMSMFLADRNILVISMAIGFFA